MTYEATRFVLRFEDGTYERDMGSNRITPKGRHEYFKSVGIDDDDTLTEYLTTNIHEARTYTSARAARCSNAYSYRPKIVETLVTISAK